MSVTTLIRSTTLIIAPSSTLKHLTTSRRIFSTAASASTISEAEGLPSPKLKRSLNPQRRGGNWPEKPCGS